MRRSPRWFFLTLVIVALINGTVRANSDADRNQCIIRDTGWADTIMSGTLPLSQHPPEPLAADPSWTENPINDPNWQFRYQSLDWSGTLLAAYARTGNHQYLDRFAFIVRDWAHDNPVEAPASPFSWDQNGTALRALIYVCAWEYLPHDAWLVDAMRAHATKLADPDFYVERSNHALNQDMGLLALGCTLDTGSDATAQDWIEVARQRLEHLGMLSIDAQGVTDEQAPAYQYYNFARYKQAFDRFERCGIEPSDELKLRWRKMPWFLSQATAPDLRYEELGDTFTSVATPITGVAEYSATSGGAGIKPRNPYASYDAGFAFGRTGWGEHRAFRDEIFYSLRYGPGPYAHGHEEGTAVTLYGYGSRLLLDAGPFTYRRSALRTYAKTIQAQNAVTIDGLARYYAAPTTATVIEHTKAWDHYLLTTGAWPGTKLSRDVFFSRLGYMIIFDRIDTDAVRTVRQRWHFMPDARPRFGTDSIRTRRAQGNVEMYWFDDSTLKWTTGDVGLKYDQPQPAPIAEALQTGTSARFLTLIVPAESRSGVSVTKTQRLDDGYGMTVTLNGQTERVAVTGHHARCLCST